jgi:hypothetical protein
VRGRGSKRERERQGQRKPKREDGVRKREARGRARQRKRDGETGERGSETIAQTERIAGGNSLRLAAHLVLLYGIRPHHQVLNGICLWLSYLIFRILPLGYVCGCMYQ